MTRHNTRHRQSLRDLDRLKKRSGMIARKVFPPQTDSPIVHPSTRSRARKGDDSFWFYRAVEAFEYMRDVGQSRQDAEVVLLSLRREANRIWSDEGPAPLVEVFHTEQELDAREDAVQAPLIGRPLEEVSTRKLEAWVEAASEVQAATEEAIRSANREIADRRMGG